MAWQKNDEPDTLGSSGDVLQITGLTGFKFNLFLSHIIGGATDIEVAETYNNNTNSVYAQRSEVNGSADATQVSQANILNAVRFSADKFLVEYLFSVSDEEKLMIQHFMTGGNAGAANSPDRMQMTAKFVPVPDAGVTRIDLNNTQAGSYQTDSNLSALGTD